MTTKEREQLEVIVTHLVQGQIAVGKDKSWGLALERMANAADAIHALLDAKPRAKKEEFIDPGIGIPTPPSENVAYNNIVK